jgi:CRP/FNR family transcriptional regulator, anaerobic regulatory protein
MLAPAAAPSFPSPQRRTVPVRNVASAPVAKLMTLCSSCNLREVCLPCGLNEHDADRADELVYTRRRLRRGETLYRAADPFGFLYAVRSGFFKTTQTLQDGREQVTGFYMAGELLGMDGIWSEVHGCDAIGLEDSEVCVIPYARLQTLGREVPDLQQQFHKVMSREIAREHGVMLLLGTMRAEERLAAFLLNLSQRFGARGFSPSEFHLRMTREEIGSYLGLKLETVSRAFSKFQEEGLISVQQKHVLLVDPAGLRRAMGERTV